MPLAATHSGMRNSFKRQGLGYPHTAQAPSWPDLSLQWKGQRAASSHITKGYSTTLGAPNKKHKGIQGNLQLHKAKSRYKFKRAIQGVLQEVPLPHWLPELHRVPVLPPGHLLGPGQGGLQRFSLIFFLSFRRVLLADFRPQEKEETADFVYFSSSLPRQAG